MSRVIATHSPINIKPCLLPMEDLGLLLRCNGEQDVQILDRSHNIYIAGIPAPTIAPALVSVSSSANKLPLGYYGYAYVYAATDRYPLIDAGFAINGSISPRGNPSSALIVNASNASNQVIINVTGSTRLDISEIWIFRTDTFATLELATQAAASGLLFYIGKLDNPFLATTLPYTDNSPTVTIDRIELDNYTAPLFKFAVYEPPYVWGWGNDPFIASVSWASNVVNLIDSSTSWFPARNGQIATVTGITTGGFDGKGSFYFLQIDNTTASLTADGTTPATLTPSIGTGIIKIQGFSTTLYRSKANNPLSWGETDTFGSVQTPRQFAIKIGGGRGTAIAVLPGGETLKLDVKDPTNCYIFNLRLAGQSEFASSRRKISNYSVGSHHSQFVATTAEGQKVLWGYDPDSFAILQCDGASQYPISLPLQDTLRRVDTHPERTQFYHGAHIPSLNLNVMWVGFTGRANYEIDQIVGGEIFFQTLPYSTVSNWTDLALIQHYPSGKWYLSKEFDLTTSGTVRDNNIDKLAVLGGTATGIIGTLFDNLLTGSLTVNVQPDWLDQTTLARNTTTLSSFSNGMAVWTISTGFGGEGSAVLTESYKGVWFTFISPTSERRIYLRCATVTDNGDGSGYFVFDTAAFDTTFLVGVVGNYTVSDPFYTSTGSKLISQHQIFTTTDISEDEIDSYIGFPPSYLIKNIQKPDDIRGLKRLAYLSVGPVNYLFNTGTATYFKVIPNNGDMSEGNANNLRTGLIQRDMFRGIGLPKADSINLQLSFYFASTGVQYPNINQILVKVT